MNLPQEKMNFINDTHQKELQYWKGVALQSKNENGRKKLTDLAPLRVFLGSQGCCKKIMQRMLTLTR